MYKNFIKPYVGDPKPIEKKLKSIDPMNITPMEALNIICELKKDLK